jgi:hypothetical protein
VFPWDIRAPTRCIHLLNEQLTAFTFWTNNMDGTSVDMQKEIGRANFSVPFQILWLTIIYGARITGNIGY